MKFQYQVFTPLGQPIGKLYTKQYYAYELAHKLGLKTENVFVVIQKHNLSYYTTALAVSRWVEADDKLALCNELLNGKYRYASPEVVQAFSNELQAQAERLELI